MVVRVSYVWFHMSRFVIGMSSAQKHGALKDGGLRCSRDNQIGGANSRPILILDVPC